MRPTPLQRAQKAMALVTTHCMLLSTFSSLSYGAQIPAPQIQRADASPQSASISVSGSSPNAKEDALEKAKQAGMEVVVGEDLMEGAAWSAWGYYDAAAGQYQDALKLAPANPAAGEGLAAVQQKLAAQLEAHRTADEWVDTHTQLMWTLKDNGRDVNWQEAFEYCKALRTGGFSDWRLPDDLELFAMKTPTQAGYHIKGGIELTGPVVWGQKGAYADNAPAADFGGVTDFGHTQRPLAEKKSIRALCNRPYVAVAEAGAPKGEVGPGSNLAEAQKQPQAGSAEMEEQAASLVDQKRYIEAFPLAADACSRGDREGCRIEGSLYADGNGVEKNQRRGVMLIARACVAGSGEACTLIGEMGDMGSGDTGVEKNYRWAAVMYNKGCNAGSARGCFHLATFYKYKRSVDIDVDVQKAHELYQKSCAMGFAPACREITVSGPTNAAIARAEPAAPSHDSEDGAKAAVGAIVLLFVLAEMGQSNTNNVQDYQQQQQQNSHNSWCLAAAIGDSQTAKDIAGCPF
jgi:TPR repeat protein